MIVTLVGPIKHWWDCWDSWEHQNYVAWRDALSAALVDAGHLVYRPHEAFKGAWNESAQRVNDMALGVCDVVVNMTPGNVPSYGTDDEIDYARRYNRTVINVPPPAIARSRSDYPRFAADFSRSLEQRVETIRESVDLAKVARNLLWALDNPGGGQAADFIREARAALGNTTPARGVQTESSTV